VRSLGKFAGATHVGVNVEELPPGKQSCPFHYHMLKEEHLLMREGHATLRVLRGGSWHDTPDVCRSAVRLKLPKTEGDDFYGFRVAMSLPDERMPA
jgi:uncharacterized cupin superfamily protein